MVSPCSISHSAPGKDGKAGRVFRLSGENVDEYSPIFDPTLVSACHWPALQSELLFCVLNGPCDIDYEKYITHCKTHSTCCLFFITLIHVRGHDQQVLMVYSILWPWVLWSVL